MTCQHRHLSAIPGGRYACTDDPTCRCTFTVTTDGEAPSHAVKVLAAHLADADERIAMARSKASTQARMASLRHRDQEERNWLDVINLLGGDACVGQHQWQTFRDLTGEHTKCLLCGARNV